MFNASNINKTKKDINATKQAFFSSIGEEVPVDESANNTNKTKFRNTITRDDFLNQKF
jgi:hypothetical protein